MKRESVKPMTEFEAAVTRLGQGNATLRVEKVTVKKVAAYFCHRKHGNPKMFELLSGSPKWTEHCAPALACLLGDPRNWEKEPR